MAVWDSTVVDGSIRSGVILWSAQGATLLDKGPSPFEQPFLEFEQCIEESDRERTVSTMQAAVERQDSYELEYRIHSASGTKWIFAKARVLRDPDGNPTGTLGVIADVTARIEREMASMRSDRLAEITLMSIGDAVIRTDATGKTTFMNRAAEALTAMVTEHAVGADVAHVLRLIDEATGEPINHPVYRCLQQQHSIGNAPNVQLLTHAGRRVDVDSSVAPIRPNTGG